MKKKKKEEKKKKKTGNKKTGGNKISSVVNGVGTLSLDIRTGIVISRIPIQPFCCAIEPKTIKLH